MWKPGMIIRKYWITWRHTLSVSHVKLSDMMIYYIRLNLSHVVCRYTIRSQKNENQLVRLNTIVPPTPVGNNIFSLEGLELDIKIFGNFIHLFGINHFCV